MNTIAQSERLLTAEEFARLPEPADGSKQELVRGRIVTMPPPGFEHGAVQLIIGALLYDFVKSNKLGRVTTESGVRTERGEDTVRGPDVSFWSYERVPVTDTPKSYPEAAADLCIEVRSPSQSFRDLRVKAGEYLTAGVRMVWIVDPEDRSVTVFRKPGQGTILGDDQVLSGDDILPGFSCLVAKLFG